MKILVVDVGGSSVKVLATGQADRRKVPSGKRLTAQRMVEEVLGATADWPYDVVSIGYPGPVDHNGAKIENPSLGEGWVGFDFAAAFGKPVKVLNDAAMQALGSYEGGRMLFLGFGTGLGSTLISNRVIISLELGQLFFRKEGILADHLSRRGRKLLGNKVWQRTVEEVVSILKRAFVADYVVLGGGEAKKVDPLPPGTRLGDNDNAFTGGYRLWDTEVASTQNPDGQVDHPPVHYSWKQV